MSEPRRHCTLPGSTQWQHPAGRRPLARAHLSGATPSRSSLAKTSPSAATTCFSRPVTSSVRSVVPGKYLKGISTVGGRPGRAREARLGVKHPGPPTDAARDKRVPARLPRARPPAARPGAHSLAFDSWMRAYVLAWTSLMLPPPCRGGTPRAHALPNSHIGRASRRAARERTGRPPRRLLAARLLRHAAAGRGGACRQAGAPRDGTTPPPPAVFRHMHGGGGGGDTWRFRCPPPCR